MIKKEFFPPKTSLNPKIYAYKLLDVPSHEGFLKIGFTTRDVNTRVAEQIKITALKYKIVLNESAMRSDGTSFLDHEVHEYLKSRDFKNYEGEWFKCDVKDVQAAILAIRDGIKSEDNRILTFKMRPEQEIAVEKTANYFINIKKDSPKETPHFLWNAKMRFGKTFATYKLAEKMGWKKILVLTFKPAVESAWKDDLKSHVDFEGWQFISDHTDGINYDSADKEKPIVCFGSFQNYLGNNSTGGIKAKNKWAHAINWDCVVFDEYHFGAWNNNAKGLFGDDFEVDEEIKYNEKLNKNGFQDEDKAEKMEYIIPITTDHYLYLSGTPFRALSSGEFIEEQIFSWTYSDEQKAKEEWLGENNPYLSLPRMVLLTYQLPDAIRDVALKGEYNEFDLNLFFSAEGKEKDAKFIYKNEVQKWLDLIRGSFKDTISDDLKIGYQKPPMPFSHAPLKEVLNHTFWFLPNIASCYAMANLIKERQNSFYKDFEIIVAAGTKAGIGINALPPVLNAMAGNPLKSKTITLSCGKLTTGVSVKPWTGIFMLRNSSSPETYFQAAFRVQTPWTIKNYDGKSPNKIEIVKKECYVFDFAPNRALSQISSYACRLNVKEPNPEKSVAEFINFLPILAYDGSSMKLIDAAGVLDIATSGTTATLLARRWESALLVNVDNFTLSKLLENDEAMRVLMNIEGFRRLNNDIETIINKSNFVKKIKKEANNRNLTKEEKKELTKEEKEYKNKRKQIQERLIKFATRIPVFMYLTDLREQTLEDVITKLEPALFKKVTGLTNKDFELLVSLGLFNNSLMNDAVLKFKRYEDSSLSYAGINMHEGEDVGLFNTALKNDEFKKTFYNVE